MTLFVIPIASPVHVILLALWFSRPKLKLNELSHGRGYSQHRDLGVKGLSRATRERMVVWGCVTQRDRDSGKWRLRNRYRAAS